MQRSAAKQRGIEWLISFDDWCAVWMDSGKWSLRGRNKGKYCMSRIGDAGPYSKENVFIQLHGMNTTDAHKGRKDGPLSDDHKRKLRLPRKPMSLEARARISAARKGKNMGNQNARKLRTAGVIGSAPVS